MARVFNFSAGPAVLPETVLQQAAAEMLDWHGSGMSVMEMSHRGKEFISIHAEAEKDLRELLAVPANYKVLFLQGGAIAENAPLSVRQAKKSIHYGMQTDIAIGYRFEIEAYNRLVTTEDRLEGVRAFNEKRKPAFRGR